MTAAPAPPPRPGGGGDPGRAVSARLVDARLLRHATAARRYLLAAVGLGLAAAALILAQAGLLATVLATAVRGGGMAAIRGPVLLLLGVVAARAVLTGAGEAAALRAAARVKSQLRRSLAARALRLGPAWLAGQQTGELTALATRGLDGLDSYFARYLPQLVLAVVVPVAVLARVAAADWLSAVIIAATLPLIPVFAVLVGSRTKARTRRQWRLLALLAGHFLDVVEGLPTLKVFGRAKAQEQVIGKVTDTYRATTMAALRVAFLSALVLELAAALATALVAVEAGLRLLYGHLGYQTALLVLLLTPEAYIPLRAASAQFHASMEGTAAADRVLDILETEPDDVPSPGEGPSPGGQDRPPGPAGPGPRADVWVAEIRLDEVTVTYPGGRRPSLDHLSLLVSPGERILVTGPSGAGKSTLFAVLLRLVRPSSGRITVGGTDLAALDLREWRDQIAWVPQRPYLFPGTAAENIALGRRDASDEAVRRAARLAGAAEFIESWPAGYQTKLGERATALSAGQRQQIALARAFLRDAPLLLLDEPAAHLDPASARRLGEVVAAVPPGRTVIVITHGRGWAGDTGRVVGLDAGRLLAPSGAGDRPTERVLR